MPDLQHFHALVKSGDLPGVKAALAEDAALLDQANAAGQSAYLLARYYRQAAVADYLLSLHPALDLFGQCVAGRTEAVLTAVDRDPAWLTRTNSDGWTPLHLAAFFGQSELAKALLNRGAEVEARSTNSMQNTPLHAAAAGVSLPALEVLLAHGADANARQHGGWTALHAAAQTGHQAMAELLLAHGADPRLTADNNQTALDMALSHGHAELVALLENASAK